MHWRHAVVLLVFKVLRRWVASMCPMIFGKPRWITLCRRSFQRSQWRLFLLYVLCESWLREHGLTAKSNQIQWQGGSRLKGTWKTFERQNLQLLVVRFKCHCACCSVSDVISQGDGFAEPQQEWLLTVGGASPVSWNASWKKFMVKMKRIFWDAKRNQLFQINAFSHDANVSLAEVRLQGVSQLLKQSDWAQIQDFKCYYNDDYIYWKVKR